MPLARCCALALAAGLLLAGPLVPVAHAALVPVTFSGAGGTPLTITLPQSVTYTVTTVPVGGVLFDFKAVGNIFGGTVNVGGTMTYSVNGGSPNTITNAGTATSAGAIAPTDLLLNHNPATGVALGDTIVLSGSVTTAINVGGAAPTSGSYSAIIVDQTGAQIGAGAIPEPASVALLVAGGLALLARRARRTDAAIKPESETGRSLPIMRLRLAIVLVTFAALIIPGRARAELVTANTAGGQLITFDSSTPGLILSNVSLSGVAGSLVGIDFRPASPGTLVGVGNNGGAGTVYQINAATGVASPINTGFALSGTSFGVDFNPVSDALRIVSNTGQNLRITSGGSGVVNVDAAINIGSVTTSNVVSAAYANNVAGAAATTLYVLQDNAAAGTDSLFIQNPPNNGTLTSPVTLTINVSQLAGFDIKGDSQAFLSWNGGNQFGTLNLTTGQAVNTGAVGGGFAGQIAGIAVAVPEPTLLGPSGLAAIVTCTSRRRRR